MRIPLTLAIAAAVAVPTGIVAEIPTTDIAPLLASTFFGGGDEESTVDVALGPDGSIYILGFTLSADLPTTPGAFDRTYNPPGPDEFGGDAFVARLDAGANTLIYSTYLGGTDTDYPQALAVGPGYNGDFDAVASRLEIPERASLHVAAVEARYRPAGPGFVVAAAIAVRDAWSHPISGARVGVELALPDGGAVALAATTDARGVARVGRAVRSPGTYSFTVIDVRAEAWVYAPHQNLETGDRVTIP